MGAKRALIVDDSKSARLFLARILEKYEIDVDNAENAEAAIEYLTSHRPDVIFMDHLMPGMDGFQAVQAIKNNPLTATIPIMMYTSQEGELYLGQARALGAVGVLPKQIKPTDVSKVLYQLHLLQDRRSTFQTSFRPINVASPAETGADQGAANDSGVLPKILTETALREQFAELRRALVAGVDTQTERITAEVRALLLEAFPPGAPTAETAVAPTLPARSGPQWAWVVASIALAIALATTALWWQQVNQLRTLSSEVAQLRRDLTGSSDETGAGDAAAPAGAALGSSLGSAGKGSTADRVSAAKRASALDGEGLKTTDGAPTTGNGSGPPPRALPTDSKPLVISVPYGADALGGSRLEMVRQLLDRLVKENHRGVVDIKSFPGRFCLMGNANDGFSLAPDETPFTKCDAVGNPSDDALSPAQRTPLPFANLVGAIRNSSHGALNVQTSVGDATTTITPYPQLSPELTAGEWNRAGGANNRLEIRVR
ncbi:MAG: response regulator [Steroidobacteraceae bacterium]